MLNFKKQNKTKVYKGPTFYQTPFSSLVVLLHFAPPSPSAALDFEKTPPFSLPWDDVVTNLHKFNRVKGLGG